MNPKKDLKHGTKKWCWKSRIGKSDNTEAEELSVCVLVVSCLLYQSCYRTPAQMVYEQQKISLDITLFRGMVCALRVYTEDELTRIIISTQSNTAKLY